MAMEGEKSTQTGSPSNLDEAAPQNPSPIKKLPPKLNFYTAFTNFWLGRSENEKLFATSFGWGMLGRTVITIYDGPSKDDPVLVTSRHKSSKYIITLPSGPGSLSVKHGRPEGDGEDIPLSGGGSGSYGFSMRVGSQSTEGSESPLEDFIWRRSSSDEMKRLSGFTKRGWKLVRDAPPTATADGTGIVDASEIVLVMVKDESFRKKSTQFCFVGRGLAGDLGERWELVAVLSGLLLWWKSYMLELATSSIVV